jgi:hypothetical protein
MNVCGGVWVCVDAPSVDDMPQTMNLVGIDCTVVNIHQTVDAPLRAQVVSKVVLDTLKPGEDYKSGKRPATASQALDCLHFCECE